MKITMYELYGKIYDENPPKHIKVYGEDWYWNDYDGYVTKESLKTTPDAQIYLMDRYRTFMNLDKEVEIIEEDKKIEKLEIEKDENTQNYFIRNEYGTKCYLTKHSKIIASKFNELIDEINNLKENKYEWI